MNRSNRFASRVASFIVRPDRRVMRAVVETVEVRRLLASVSGLVFSDANADGVRQNGEAGLAGEVVYADRNNNGTYDAGDVATRTDAGGTYAIPNLPADGATITIRVRGDAGARVVAPVGGGQVVTLASAASAVAGENFAVGPTAVPLDSVDGFVYADVDKSGGYSPGDTQPAGVTVFADYNGNGKRDVDEPTTTGDSRGFYQLANVPVTGRSMTFVARVPANGGTTTGTATFVLPASAHPVYVDILYAPPANITTIAGTVRRSDTNAGLGSEVVYLDRNDNGTYDAGDVATRTDVNGDYVFPSVTLDGSTIAVRLRSIAAPRTVTAPVGGAYVLRLSSGAMTGGLNFSVAPSAPKPTTTTVSGSIYNDANGNAKRDAGEAGLIGRYGQFGVYADLNRDGVEQPNEPSVYSDFLSSDYTLTNIPVGATFDVRFAGLSPADDGLYQTGPAGFNRPPLTLTTTTAAPITNANFGFLGAGSIVADAFIDLNNNGKADLDGVTNVSDPRLDDGVIWLDLDGDHRRDANEPGIPRLLRDDETPGPGLISFGVPYGTYTVAYSRSTALNALADATTIVTSTPNAGSVYAKVAVPPTAPGVSGLAFRDDNGDGVREAYETPLSAATIYADYNNNGKLDADEPSTTVDHPYIGETFDASYYLPVTAGRSFTLRVDAPDVAPGKTYALKLTGAQQATANFAATPLRATVRGRVYNDVNLDGKFDAGDTPRASEVVYDDVDADGVYDHGDIATRTDADGYYTLSNVVRDGAYIRLRGVAKPLISQSDYDGSYSLSLPAEGASGIDFGVRVLPPSQAAGRVFVDANANGAYDSGEVPFQAYLFADVNNNGRFDAGEPTTYLSSGRYQFAKLPDHATFEIFAVTFGNDATGLSPNPGLSFAVSTDAGGKLFQHDFAFPVLSGAVTGRVYGDANANGTRDAGEPGVSGVSVYADLDGDGRFDHDDVAATTLSDGSYTLVGLPNTGSTTTIRVGGTDAARVTSPASNAYAAALDGGGDAGFDFGLRVVT